MRIFTQVLEISYRFVSKVILLLDIDVPWELGLGSAAMPTLRQICYENERMVISKPSLFRGPPATITGPATGPGSCIYSYVVGRGPQNEVDTDDHRFF